MSVYKRGKKGTRWHYYFRVRGVRYRGAIPEARTKWDAEQAWLVDERSHLRSMVIIALGLGLRKREQFEIEARPSGLFPERGDCQPY